MRQKNKGEGTKIAQAAKELNVTSVTIRRYITEFNIETTADENGIKVLPSSAMEELCEIRRLKEEGLTNPKVLEHLEERRSKPQPEPKARVTKEKDKEKEKEKEKPAAVEVPRRAVRRTEAPAAAARATRKVVVEPEEEEVPEQEQEEDAPVAPVAVRSRRIEPTEAESESESDEDADDEDGGGAGQGDGKSKYSLTCQTCNKVFEHMNPRLRDCLDCYRIKRKERRRGGDKKNVIQNPLAQQVVTKNQQAADRAAAASAPLPLPVESAPAASAAAITTARPSIREALNFAPPGTIGYQRPQVRNYRKAIEETRQITSNLKRRLERPDLPEAERRFLEQIYAYQLILHQGWRHLAEYKSGGTEGRD